MILKTGRLILLVAVPLAAWGATTEEFYGQRTSFEKVVRDGQGRLRGGVLEKETTVTQGDITLVLPANQELTLYANGRLKRAMLGGDLDLKLFLGNLPVAAGTLLDFQESGELDLRKNGWVLREDSNVTIGAQPIPLKKGSRLFFIDNQTLDFSRSELTLSRYHAFKFKPFALKAKIESEVTFHENGAVRSVVLGEAVSLPVAGGAVTVDETSRLFFLPSGELDFDRSVILPREEASLSVGGQSFPFAKGQPLLFHLTGGVRQGVLAKDARIRVEALSLAVKAGTTVKFEPDGAVDPRDSHYQLTEDAQLLVGQNRFAFKKGTTLHYHLNGMPSGGMLADGVEISVHGKNIPLAKESPLFFLDSGDIDVLKTPLVLNRPTLMTVAGHPLLLASGTRLYLTTEGDLDVNKTHLNLAEPASFQFRGKNLPIASGRSLAFSPEGTLERLTLGAPVVLAVGNKSMEFPAGTVLTYTAEGRLTSARLGDNTRVARDNFDLVFAKDSDLTFSEDEHLLHGVLGPGNVVPMGVHRVPLPEKMELDFTPQENPVLLSVTLKEDAPFVIKGRAFIFNGGSTLVFNSKKELDLPSCTLFVGQKGTFPLGPNSWKVKEGAALALFKSGEVRSIDLAESQEMKLGALRIPLAVPRRVFFHPDGTVDSLETEIVLANEMSLPLGPNTLPLGAGTRLYFQSNGLLDFTRLTLALGKDTLIRVGKQEWPLVKGTVLEYHQNGSMDLERTSFVLSKKVKKTVRGVEYTFQQGGSITFHRNGELASAAVAEEDVKINLDKNELLFKGQRNYVFNEDGSLDSDATSLDLVQDQIVTVGAFSIPFKTGQTLRFHSNGRLKSGLILEPVTLTLGRSPIRMKKDNVLYFTEEGFLDTVLTQVILEEPLALTVGRNTIPFLEGTRIYFYNSGDVWQGILGREMALKVFNHEIPFKKGKRLYFFVNGEVDCDRTELYLLADQRFPVGKNELMFQARKRLFLGPKGNVARGWLTGLKSISVGAGTFEFDSTAPVSFHDNGTVAGLTLSGDTPTSVAGSTVTFSKGTEVLFYPNGILREGELKENTFLRQALFKSFTKISFYPNGGIQRGELKEAASLRVGDQTVRMDSGFPVEFYNNGSLAGGRLASAAKIRGSTGDVILKGLSDVRFHSNGRLSAGTMDEGAVFSMGAKSLEVNPGSAVTFYENGQLKEGYSRLPWRMTVRESEVTLDPRATIGFFENGAVREGVLLTNAEVSVGTEKILFAEGTKIRFHSDGKVATGFSVTSVRLPVAVWPDRKILCAPLRELSWDSAGRLVYANVDEPLVYQSPAKESFTLLPGEWVYMDYLEGGLPQAYPIDLHGRLKRDTPFKVGGQRLILPRESLVAFKGDDTILTLISPSAPIVFQGEVLAPGHTEIVITDLEAKLKSVGEK